MRQKMETMQKWTDKSVLAAITVNKTRLKKIVVQVLLKQNQHHLKQRINRILMFMSITKTNPIKSLPLV